LEETDIENPLRLLELFRGRNQRPHNVLELGASRLEPDFALVVAGLAHAFVAEILGRPVDCVPREMKLPRNVIQFMPCAVSETHPDIP